MTARGSPGSTRNGSASISGSPAAKMGRRPRASAPSSRFEMRPSGPDPPGTRPSARRRVTTEPADVGSTFTSDARNIGDEERGTGIG